MKSLPLKFIVLFLMAGLNYSGLLAVGQTLAYYNDTENSTENTFSATTLDFSLTPSDWNPVESEVSLELGNTAYKEVGMQNDGILDFQYTVETDNESGDADFCSSLNLRAELLGGEMYNGSLTGFLSTATNAVDVWNYRIDTPTNYQNSVCNFDFLYNGWQLDMPSYGSGGFTDTEKVENKIASWGLRINKVYYDVAPDRGTEYDNEWIEIYNQTNVPLDISGWDICDNISCDAIPSSAPIPAEGFAVITGNSSTWAYWNVPSDVVRIVLADGKVGNGLNNDTDMLILKRPDGTMIDQMNWGDPDTGWTNYNDDVWSPGATDVPEGNILGRKPNGYDINQASDFIEFGPPDLNLIYPDQSGTLVWYWTYTYNILWAAANPNGDDNDISIDLYYIKDINHDSVVSAGDTVHTIVINTANDGLYAWKVPSGFLGYIWIKAIARGPENPMLTDAMVSGKIYDPFPLEMLEINPELVMQAMIEAGIAVEGAEIVEDIGGVIGLDDLIIEETENATAVPEVVSETLEVEETPAPSENNECTEESMDENIDDAEAKEEVPVTEAESVEEEVTTKGNQVVEEIIEEQPAIKEQPVVVEEEQPAVEPTDENNEEDM